MSENRNNNSSRVPGRGPGGGPGMRGPLEVEKPKDSKNTLKRLLKYLGASKYMLIALVIFVILTSLTQLAGPVFQ